MTAENKNIGVVIIAAGSSDRLGRPKQLLQYGGETLLQHMVQVAGASIARTIVIVLGANADRIIKEIDFGDMPIVINENWREGMAASIRCGIQALVATTPPVAGAVILLCDQPHVTSPLLNNLIATSLHTGKPIAASEYNGILGTPAFFQKSIFPELLGLKGDMGARAIIQQHGNAVASVAFPQGSVDIDTATDYEEFLHKSQLL